MYKIIFLRHGQSIWNKENLFTGWTDVDLSNQGKKEAIQAGKLLKKEGFTFDLAYTSVLKRAIRTLWLALDQMDLMWIPVHRAWELNERHYGDLQGLNKKEMAKKVGPEQVLIWRRSFDVKPPLMSTSDKRYPGKDQKYKNNSYIPKGECLKDTILRVLPYWEKTIVPSIKKGKKIIIVAHGNSLRALVMHLDNISEKDIPNLNIPTGIPLLYELDKNLKPISHRYLGDQEKIKKAALNVKNQGKI